MMIVDATPVEVGSLAHVQMRVDELEAIEAARMQRARDYHNQTIGFVVGVAWTLVLLYAIRR